MILLPSPYGQTGSEPVMPGDLFSKTRCHKYGQDDNPLYCMSASESNGYKWQTNINNDDGKTRVDISWADHFVNEVHEAGHVLSSVGSYQPRLTDGFICVMLLINFITVNLTEI
jgi:hypothetical protein